MLLPFHTQGLLEAGCDEAGRGCLAGPVFAAAVILPPGFTCPELNDSKQLNEKARDQLRLIIEREALHWAVAKAEAPEIDQYNILWASVLAMHRAISQLPVTPELLLIDGNRFKKYQRIPHICVVKGDSKFQSIAAASILAKTWRDDYMKELHTSFPEYDWISNKGYPTARHRQAIAGMGTTVHHRTSFQLLPVGTEVKQLHLFEDISGIPPVQV